MHIKELLIETIQVGASDLHITVGAPPIIRVHGELQWLEQPVLTVTNLEELIQQLLTPKQLEVLEENHQVDLSYSQSGYGRFRVNVYKQRGSYSAAFRTVMNKIPSREELGLLPVVDDLCRKQRGLVLVTGPTGSGKSTTLAYMINLINQERKSHIITLEDPIEYLYKHNKSIINQREIGGDVLSFADGLRAALRQDPDIILVGEMRDLETISIAVTAAETGHLVFSTLHTVSAAKTIDRIVDVFPTHQQQQIKVQLASVLVGIVSQQLLPKADGSGRVAAVEVMVANSAVRNLIREGKTFQIQNVIQTGSKAGMQTLDESLIKLFNNQLITRETVLQYCVETDMVKRYLSF